MPVCAMQRKARWSTTRLGILTSIHSMRKWYTSLKIVEQNCRLLDPLLEDSLQVVPSTARTAIRHLRFEAVVRTRNAHEHSHCLVDALFNERPADGAKGVRLCAPKGCVVEGMQTCWPIHKEGLLARQQFCSRRQ